MYNHSVNKVLEHAVLSYEGERPPRLRGCELDELLPSPPKPGQVDALYGGKSFVMRSLLNYTLASYRSSMSRLLSHESYQGVY